MTDIPLPGPAGSTLRHVGYVLRSNPVTMLAFGMLGVLLFAALLGPAVAPYDPYA